MLPSRFPIVFCLLIFTGQTAQAFGFKFERNMYCQLYNKCMSRAFLEQRKCDNRSMESIVKNRGKIFTEIVSNYSSNSATAIAIVRNCVRSAIYNAILVADEADPVLGQREFMTKCLLESPAVTLCQQADDTREGYETALYDFDQIAPGKRQEPKRCRNRVENLMKFCTNFRTCCPAAKRCENRWQMPAQLPHPMNEESIAITARNCIDLALERETSESLAQTNFSSEMSPRMNRNGKSIAPVPPSPPTPSTTTPRPIAKSTKQPQKKQLPPEPPGHVPPSNFFAKSQPPLISLSIDEKKSEKDMVKSTEEKDMVKSIENQMSSRKPAEAKKIDNFAHPPKSTSTTTTMINATIATTLTPPVSIDPRQSTIPSTSTLFPTLMPTPPPVDYHRMVDLFRLGLQYYQTTTQWMRAFTIPTNMAAFP